MNFRKAEQRFEVIHNRYRAGEISADEYRAELNRLRVTDGAGRLWMMQEMTGRWHVWDEGGWRPAPPPTAEQAPVAARRDEATPLPPGDDAAREQHRNMSPTAPNPRRRWLVWGCGGLAALIACCLVTWFALGGLGVLLELAEWSPQTSRSGELGTPRADDRSEETPAAGGVEEVRPGISLSEEEVVSVAVGGAAQTDEAGTTLRVPEAAAVEASQARLVSYALDGPLLAALQESYVLETPFYAATLEGSEDSVGRAELRLPAASAESRIVTLIDGRYTAILGVEPEGGFLALEPRLGPSDQIGGEMVGSLAPGGTIHYAVIHPRESTGGNQRGPGRSAPASLVDPLDCTVPDDPGYLAGPAAELCRRNAAGSVFVTYYSGVAVTDEQVDRVVEGIEQMMESYAALGFTAAQISPANSMHVVIESGGGDAYYRPSNGMIYIPAVLAQSMGEQASGNTAAAVTGSTDLLHEMAHWIQDESYAMLLDFWIAESVWWLETAAENMVMLVDPARMDQNLASWGQARLDDSSRLAFQYAPGTWPSSDSELYVHAHLVKVNTCDDAAVCPLSQESFVNTINNGGYPVGDTGWPFSQEGAAAMVNANLDDYARYLLGLQPVRANRDIPRPPSTQEGADYGDSVEIWEKGTDNFYVSPSNYPPQMVWEKEGGLDRVVIHAVLDRNGVYPLRVTSGGSRGRSPGLPASLRVSPGVSLWYRVEEGEAQYHDGTEELVIEPIHAKKGVTSVRLVALGRSGGERFQAQVGVVSLSGVWVFTPEKLISHDVTCKDEEGSEESEGMAEGATQVIGLAGASGDYVADEIGNRLTWRKVTGRVQGEVSDIVWDYSGRATVNQDEVTVQAQLHIPRPAHSGGGPRAADVDRWAPWATLALGTTLPLALWTRRESKHAANGHRGWTPWRGWRRWRPFLVLVVAVGMGSLLTGCFGLLFYGDLSADMTFTGLEYVGGQETVVVDGDGASDAEPIWRLEGGRAEVDVDLTTVTFVEDEEGKEEEHKRRCKGTAVYEMTRAIYQDAVVDLTE